MYAKEKRPPGETDERPNQNACHSGPAVRFNAQRLNALEERLSESVEWFNASQDPAERIELHHEIKKLRQLIN